MAQKKLNTDEIKMILPDHIVEHPDFPRASICPPDVLIRVPRGADASGATLYTDFYCHKNFLVFASEGFKSALCGGWKESYDPQSLKGGRHGQIWAASSDVRSPTEDTAAAATSEDGTVTRYNELNLSGTIVLKGDDVTVVEQFLRLIYPHLEHKVTWANCQALSAFADKWEVPLLLNACKNFLRSAFSEQPLLAVAIADRYRWDQLYEQASGLALLAWPPAEASRALGLSPEALHRVWQMHHRALSSLCSRLIQDNWPLAAESHGTCQVCSSCASKVKGAWVASLKVITASASWNIGEIVQVAEKLDVAQCALYSHSCSRPADCLRCCKIVLMKDLETLFGVKLLDK